MKITFRILAFLATMTLYPFSGGSGVEGKWAVRYVSGLQLKTIGGADFEFKVLGNALTGTAKVGYGWPGVAPISDGRVEGNRISFTVQGRQWSSSGYPKMRFAGTTHGDEIKLTMEFYEDVSTERPMGQTEFKGKRVSAN